MEKRNIDNLWKALMLAGFMVDQVQSIVISDLIDLVDAKKDNIQFKDIDDIIKKHQPKRVQEPASAKIPPLRKS